MPSRLTRHPSTCPDTYSRLNSKPPNLDEPVFEQVAIYSLHCHAPEVGSTDHAHGSFDIDLISSNPQTPGFVAFDYRTSDKVGIWRLELEQFLLSWFVTICRLILRQRVQIHRDDTLEMELPGAECW
jgi:hypothetical protein